MYGCMNYLKVQDQLAKDKCAQCFIVLFKYLPLSLHSINKNSATMFFTSEADVRILHNLKQIKTF